MCIHVRLINLLLWDYTAFVEFRSLTSTLKNRPNPSENVYCTSRPNTNMMLALGCGSTLLVYFVYMRSLIECA